MPIHAVASHLRDQLRQIKKMGSVKSVLKMLPTVDPFAGMQQAIDNVDEGQFTRVESIINSMTKKERIDHEIIAATGANASPKAPEPPSRTSTTSYANTPRCERSSKPWAQAEASKPSKE